MDALAHSATAHRRIARVAAHVRARVDVPVHFLAMENCAAEIDLDATTLNRFLDKHNFETRRDFLEELKQPLFTPLRYDISVNEQRSLTVRRLKRLSDLGVSRLLLIQSPSVDEQLKNQAISECLYLYDHSLIVKLGAVWALWGASVKNLGTEVHHAKYLKDIAELRLPGCFALTEFGHGSNVRGIETIATYDPESHEFIINTPTESAQKNWIGGATMAHAATVFAQLHIEGENKGIHAFVVPLRDSNGNVLPHIRIADCGHKMGLNGVDNGRLWFDKVRIPRENLLNRLANVTEDGAYESMIDDPDMRFAASIGELVLGRVSLCGGANQVAKLGLAIAIAYSLERRQFGPPGGPERPIMDYKVHQYRLIPLLATSYALGSAGHSIMKQWVTRSDDISLRVRQMKDIHILASGLKGLAGWHMSKTLQTCREACGGNGVASWNRIGILKADTDVFLTFEGDNNVLLAQNAGQLIREYNRHLKSGFAAGSRLEYLNALIADNPLREPLKARAWDSEKHAFVDVRVDGSHLRSAEFQTRVFEAREADLLQKLSRALADCKAAGMDDEASWNDCGPLAAQCGLAYCERYVLGAFVRDIAADGSAFLQVESHNFSLGAHERAVLDKLRSLFALWRIAYEPSFLSAQILTKTAVAACERECHILMSELRPHLRQLVRAFNIPDHLLAPIATEYETYGTYDRAVNASEYLGRAVY